MTVRTPSPDRLAPAGGLGTSPERPDGVLKVRGEFAYSSDLWAEGMLWGATLRSPHPSAEIRALDCSRAIAVPGVHAVLTHEDVPGAPTYGLDVADQPVLAIERVRYQGEPILLVAADHPETARHAAALVEVDYAPLEPVVDADAALAGATAAVHPGGNLLRHVPIRHGDPAAAERDDLVSVSGVYTVGMQDQAFLGPESGLAIPAEDGGVDLIVSTQWLHADRRQIASALGLDEERVRLTLGGVGGAFGAREDVSMQIHACLLALRTGRPVKMSYSRTESFFGHVHRHPARMEYEHRATRDGTLVSVRARIVLDGGAYASSSTAVVANAACFAVGPYEVRHAHVDAYVAYTNNPPCGAMRGFGAVQTCFAYESQMDRLAGALGLDPVDLRIRNAMSTGSRLPTGQAVRGPAPVAELLRRLRDRALPPPDEDGDLRARPGGVANVTHGEGVRRGIGYAVGIKNLGYSEGFDDYSTARVRVVAAGDEAVAEVHTAAVEVGQGLVTLQQQIARDALGIARVVVHPADTAIGNAGSTSASRQTHMTGGAVRAACDAVRDRLLARAAERHAGEDLALEDGRVVTADGRDVCAIAELVADAPVQETREYRPRPTTALDERGQGEPHVTFGFAAHRVVADVDCELGLVRLVEVATAQDVGRALHPQAVEGQLQGGTTQGIGLALMEEIQVRDGVVRNPSFTDYLIPTVLDVPPMHLDVLELGDPDAPHGAKGVGEPPTISSTPAVVAALRDATGRSLPRVPVRPDHLIAL